MGIPPRASQQAHPRRIRGITSLCSSAPRGSSCFPGELERFLSQRHPPPFLMRNTASGFTAGTPAPHSGNHFSLQLRATRIIVLFGRARELPFPKASFAVSLVGCRLCFTANEESRGSNLWPRDSLGRRQHRLQVQPGKILMERLTRPRIRDRIWVNAETGNSTPREGPFRELSVGARKRADAGEYLPEQDAERADSRPSRPSRVRP